MSKIMSKYKPKESNVVKLKKYLLKLEVKKDKRND